MPLGIGANSPWNHFQPVKAAIARIMGTANKQPSFLRNLVLGIEESFQNNGGCFAVEPASYRAFPIDGAEVLRALMRDYVEQARKRRFAAEARRHACTHLLTDGGLVAVATE